MTQGEARWYRNKPLMNKPLYIMGLTSGQLLIAVIAITFSVVISIVIFDAIIITLFILAITTIITVIYFRAIAKENKKGDPNNMESRTSYKSMKKEFVDSDFILHQLYEETRRK
jgi:hypothetical protein